jgi:hypothetical protein
LDSAAIFLARYVARWAAVKGARVGIYRVHVQDASLTNLTRWLDFNFRPLREVGGANRTEIGDWLASWPSRPHTQYRSDTAILTVMDSLHSLAHVPVEMRRQILREVIRMSYVAFDTSLRSPLDDAYWRHAFFPLPRLEDLSEKQAVSMVCREWRQISLAFLFEFISIQIDTLHRKVQQLYSLGPSFTCSSSPLRYTRRLEVHGVVKSREPPTCPISYEPLNAIFSQCTNLSIYMHRCLPWGGNFPALGLGALLAHCGHSLRQLEINALHLPEDAHSFSALWHPNSSGCLSAVRHI